jgi:hypothetical protein
LARHLAGLHLNHALPALLDAEENNSSDQNYTTECKRDFFPGFHRPSSNRPDLTGDTLVGRYRQNSVFAYACFFIRRGQFESSTENAMLPYRKSHIPE